MTVTIYHNPDCGTSRNTLAMIRASGEEPVVVEYLQTGWTRELLRSLATRAGEPLRSFVREKQTPAADLGILEEGVAEEVILDAMIAHPVLVNRPIVASPKGVRLCRPSELVLGLLEDPAPEFVKEDGERVGGAVGDVR